jgi:putative IMPACT (imprinted ancient) family translation regulator
MIIVTRYFGGTLLGTGGLVRAYTKASREALEDADLVRMCLCDRFTVTIDYSFLDKVMYFLRQAGITPDDTLYSDRVGIVLTTRTDLTAGVRERITSLTGGGALFEEAGQDFYPVSVSEE